MCGCSSRATRWASASNRRTNSGRLANSGPDHLDGDVAIDRRLLGPVDDGEGPVTDAFVEDVAAGRAGPLGCAAPPRLAGRSAAPDAIISSPGSRPRSVASRAAVALEHPQRLGLAPTAVQGVHQQPMGAFPERAAHRRCFERGNRQFRPSELDQRVSSSILGRARSSSSRWATGIAHPTESKPSSARPCHRASA